MSDINVGSRQVIRNSEGKVVGTFLPSKKHFGKFAVTTFLPSGEAHTTIKGVSDWVMITERNPDWTFSPSYYTVACGKEGDEVVIELTHNSVPEWNTTFRVPHAMNWQDSFLISFRMGMMSLGRETHIGNFVDLTV
jgi:hypothetical protein